MFILGEQEKLEVMRQTEVDRGTLGPYAPLVSLRQDIRSMRNCSH